MEKFNTGDIQSPIVLYYSRSADPSYYRNTWDQFVLITETRDHYISIITEIPTYFISNYFQFVNGKTWKSDHSRK